MLKKHAIIFRQAKICNYRRRSCIMEEMLRAGVAWLIITLFIRWIQQIREREIKFLTAAILAFLIIAGYIAVCKGIVHWNMIF